MKFKLFAATLLLALPLGAAHAMTIEAFLQKATALESKGMMALFSSDFKVLKREMETAGAQLRAERLATLKAGGKVSYCPPPKSSLDAKEVLTHFRSIPQAQRARMPIKEGLRSLLTRKHPCR
jgi:hypothetical protein